MPGAKIREPRRTFSLPSCGGVKAGQEFKLSRLLRPKEERKRNPWHRSARRSYYCSLPCFAHGERGDLSTFQSTTRSAGSFFVCALGELQHVTKMSLAPICSFVGQIFRPFISLIWAMERRNAEGKRFAFNAEALETSSSPEKEDQNFNTECPLSPHPLLLFLLTFQFKDRRPSSSSSDEAFGWRRCQEAFMTARKRRREKTGLSHYRRAAGATPTPDSP